MSSKFIRALKNKYFEREREKNRKIEREGEREKNKKIERGRKRKGQKDRERG